MHFWGKGEECKWQLTCNVVKEYLGKLDTSCFSGLFVNSETWYWKLKLLKIHMKEQLDNRKGRSLKDVLVRAELWGSLNFLSWPIGVVLGLSTPLTSFLQKKSGKCFQTFLKGKGWFRIRCHLFIRNMFEISTDGRYSVANGKILLSFFCWPRTDGSDCAQMAQLVVSDYLSLQEIAGSNPGRTTTQLGS